MDAILDFCWNIFVYWILCSLRTMQWSFVVCQNICVTDWRCFQRGLNGIQAFFAIDRVKFDLFLHRMSYRYQEFWNECYFVNFSILTQSLFDWIIWDRAPYDVEIYIITGDKEQCSNATVKPVLEALQYVITHLDCRKIIEIVSSLFGNIY